MYSYACVQKADFCWLLIYSLLPPASIATTTIIIITVFAPTLLLNWRCSGSDKCEKAIRENLYCNIMIHFPIVS